MSFVKFVDPCVDFGEAPAVDMFSRSWAKLASSTYMPAEVEQFLKTARPVPGHRLLLVHGLGSSEYYGANRNGDAFPEMWKGAKNLIEDNVDRGYGFKTFEKNAHTYRDHRNHDPKLSIGGKVKLAAWNDKMHRVELVIPVSEKLAGDVVDAIDRGMKIAVSMGCFIAGTLITMADGSRKPIEQIQVGDRVLTHHGRARPVTELHKRPYDGVFFAIRPEAHEPFVCTQEHPLLVVDRDQVKKDKSGGPRWVTREEAEQLEPKWLHAECFDPEQHYLLEPVPTDVLTPEYATRAFARLLGYYVAEGHVLRNKDKQICGVEFTVNKSDQFLTEVDELCAAYGTKNKPVVRQRDNTEHAVCVQVFDAEFAERCYAHGGSYAKNKKLSESFMAWHPEIQREFIGAFAEGDGCGPDDGTLRLSTGSDALAWQLLQVLARLDICASISCLTHKAGSGFSTNTTYEWVLHVGKQWAQRLRDVCSKIQHADVALTKNSRLHAGNYIITPVRELEAYRAQTDVYNFEVDEDESYVAAGVAVHNCRVPFDVCSICGNKAKHRGQYCKHAAYQMNDVLDDGRKVYVDNPQPNFFDISVLGHQGQGRPADASAYSIMKVANHEVKIFRGFSPAKKADEKKSDINKEIPATGEGLPELEAPATSEKRGPFARSELELTPEKLMEMIRQILPIDMDTADGPSPQCVITIRRTIGFGKAPKEQDEAHKVAALSTLTAAGAILRPELLDELQLHDVAIDFSKVSASMLSLLRPEMPRFSLWLPYFGDRVYRNVKLATTPRPIMMTDKYGQYLNTVKHALTNRNSVAELVKAVENSFSLKMAIARDDLAELQKFAAKGSGGPGGLSAENLVAAMLAPLLAGAYFRSQQYSGTPVGPVRSFVADHPVATGTLSALLWHKLKGGRIPLMQ